MDAQRHISRELSARGFKFNKLERPSDCAAKIAFPGDATYVGWAARKERDQLGTKVVHVVEFINHGYWASGRPGSQQKLITLSSLFTVGQTESDHRCYLVGEEMSAENTYCAKNPHYDGGRKKTPVGLVHVPTMSYRRETEDLLEFLVNEIDLVQECVGRYNAGKQFMGKVLDKQNEQ